MQSKISAKKVKLQIDTLGRFDIRVGQESILEGMLRSYKILALLKYFLNFNGKRLLPESIIDHLWPENESNDPKNILRTQIFRLRRLLDDTLPEEVRGYLNISFSGGYYILSLADGVEIDFIEFEKKLKKPKG